MTIPALTSFKHARAFVPAVITLIFGVALSSALYLKLAGDETRLIDQKVDLESHRINDKLTLMLNGRAKALRRLAHLWELHGGLSPDDWTRITMHVINDMPELRGLEWADADGVIRRVAPWATRRQFVGFDLSRDPHRGGALARAKREHKMMATPLVELKQGGIGFDLMVPLAGLTGGTTGYIVGVYELEALLHELDHHGFQLRVRDVGSNVTFSTATDTELDETHVRVIDFNDTLYQWKIEVVPFRAALAGHLTRFSRVVLACGLVISGILFLLVYLLGAWSRGNTQLRRTLAELNVYRFALDQATMVTIRDVKGHLTYVNDLFCAVSGFTRDELIGCHQSMLDDPDHPTDLSPEDWVKVRAGQMWHGDMRHRGKDGRTYWVDKTIVPCMTEEGSIYQFITILRDITARKANEDQFRDMVENMPGGAVLINANGFFANRAVEQLTGYSRDQMSSVESWFKLVYREMAPQVMAIYQSESRAGFKGSRIVPLVTSTGATRQVDIYTYRDHSSEIWLIHDVTETIAAQERFRLLFEHSADGQMIYDFADGELLILDANPAVVRMLGVTDKSELIGRSVKTFSAPYDLTTTNTPELWEARRFAIARERAEFEWDRVRADGTVFPVRVTTSPTRIDGRIVILSTWHELTAEKETQAKLVQSSKMQSLGEMSGGLAHELNTPLAIIKAKVQHLGMLARAASLAPAVLSEGLAKIELTTDRIARIVSGLRHFAQDGTDEVMSAETVATIIDDALAFCRARLSVHGVTLTLNVDQDLKVSCQPWQITQAVVNVLNNALDAVVDLETRWINVTAARNGHAVEIRVSDGGAGVPVEFRDRIMQPFFTTKPVGQGLGLGLSVATGIVELHGGVLALDDAAPNTCFVIHLPA